MSTPLPVTTPDHPDARTDLEGWAAYAKEKIDGRPVIVSVSGGKDSTATGLLLKSAGIQFECINMQTGWEADETDDYLANYLPTVLGPIRTLVGKDGGMEGLVIRKGMFASRTRRFCTQQLKVIPLRDYLRTLDDEPVNAVGVRAGESAFRSSLPEWEDGRGLDCETWRPLIDWSHQDVIDIHHRHGVKPNPLYTTKGVDRVGCWPCLFSRKSEIRAIADTDPDRIDRIERLEAKVAAVAAARHRAKGDTSTRNPPAFFQATSKDENGQRLCKPIRKVVDWSRTVRGGKQLSMFAPDYEREGCMRWGLCDSGP